MSTITPAQQVISVDVIEYARKHGVEKVLEPLLEVTKQIFPTAHNVSVHLEQDVALTDLWFIVYEVRLPAATRVADVGIAEKTWRAEERRLQPSPVQTAFVLDPRWDRT
jgi:hypothetical protein